MGFMKAPKNPDSPAAATKVEEVDDSAKRRTLLEQHKRDTGASSTLLSNPQAFGQRRTLG
jgi:hypothetical protein